MAADLGGLYRCTNRHPDALNYYREALTLYQKADDPGGQARVSCYLGDVHLDSGEPEKASEWYQRGLPLAKESGRMDVLANLEYGLARVLQIRQELHPALEHAAAAWKIYDTLRHRQLQLAQHLMNQIELEIRQAELF